MLPTSEPNWDWFIMQWGWHQVNSGFFFFCTTFSSSAAFPGKQTPVLKKYQSSVLLLHTHLLRLQCWRSNTPFVWVDTVTALSLSLCPSLSFHHTWYISPSVPPSHCFLLCLLNVTNYFSTRQSKGSSGVKQCCQECHYWTMFAGAHVKGVCLFCHQCTRHFHKCRSVCVLRICHAHFCALLVWYKGALSGLAVWIRS